MQDDQVSCEGREPPQGRGDADPAGLLLLDDSFQPLYASDKAIAILAYPYAPSKSEKFANHLQSRVRSLVLDGVNRYGALCSRFPKEVYSGRRRYQLQAFSLKSNRGIERGPAVAILLERNRSTVNFEFAARKFRLSRREKETVDLLAHDLSTKEIASRMGISPNTAKAFLRSAMIKVGAENRTGIIGRMLLALNYINGEKCA